MLQVLKNYHYKKFFRRLFWLKRPCAGVMFGFSWLLMAFIMLPVLIFVDDRTTELLSYRWAVNVLATIFILFCFYGFVTYIAGISGILRPFIKNKLLRIILVISGGFFLPLSGLLILPALIYKRRFVAIILLAFGITAYVAAENLSAPIFAIGGGVFYLAALSGTRGRRKFSWKFLYPLFISIIAVLSILLFAFCKMDNKAVAEPQSHAMKYILFPKNQDCVLKRAIIVDGIELCDNAPFEYFEGNNSKYIQRNKMTLVPPASSKELEMYISGLNDEISKWGENTDLRNVKFSVSSDLIHIRIELKSGKLIGSFYSVKDDLVPEKCFVETVMYR